MNYRQLRFFVCAAVLASFVAAAGCNHSTAGEQKRISPSNETAVNETAMNDTTGSVNVSDKVTKSDNEWRRLLTPEQYRVTQECGTEPPFTGIYYDFHGKGTYRCVACGNELFSSDTKFDSGSGWPSFWAPLAKKGVTETIDKSHGMERVEVRCSRCGAHLGHVFEDGPQPTGLRYCINSAALDFVDKDSTGAK